MLQYWKRLESKTALEWGMAGFEETQVEMPEFKGKMQPDVVDGHKRLYFPDSLRQRYMLEGYAAVFGMVLVVIGCVASIYIIKDTLVGDWQMRPTDAQTVASVINAVQIYGANVLYNLAATELTKRENHRMLLTSSLSLSLSLFVHHCMT
jgi:hypothetical protein